MDSNPPEHHHHDLKRSLNVRDMTLFTVSGMLLMDTLAASASIGVSSLSWWVIMGVVFLIPYGLISAEMGTTYPEQGGIYAWVRDNFGARWGTYVIWLYWINVALWAAATLIMFAGILAQMFFPDMGLLTRLSIAIALNWAVYLVTLMSLEHGKWIPNAGAIVKSVAFLALIIGGLVYGFSADSLANEFTLQALIPQWSGSSQYVSTIVYGMVGFELICSASEEMKNPERDIPRATLWSGVMIFLMYFLGTFALLAAIPVAEIDLVEGLVDTFYQLFGTSPLGRATATTLGLFVLLTFISNIATWSIGSNRGMAEAAADGELPALFARLHPRYETPVGSALVMALVGTAILIGYGFLADGHADLFWNIYSAGGVLLLLPNVGGIAAFYRARVADPGRHRPFRVPGGKLAALLITALCIGLILFTIFLFMYVPGEGVIWPVAIGTLISLVLGEVVIRIAEYGKRRQVQGQWPVEGSPPSSSSISLY